MAKILGCSMRQMWTAYFTADAGNQWTGGQWLEVLPDLLEVLESSQHLHLEGKDQIQTSPCHLP